MNGPKKESKLKKNRDGAKISRVRHDKSPRGAAKHSVKGLEGKTTTGGGKTVKYKTLKTVEAPRLAKFESKETKASKIKDINRIKNIKKAVGKATVKSVVKDRLKKEDIKKKDYKKYMVKSKSETGKGFGRVKKLK